MLASVSHPGLPRIHEVGYAHGRPFMIMEMVEGNNLEVLLTNGVMSEARVARMAIHVAGALAAAHQAGLVHRDVKPANIMILPDGRGRSSTSVW